MLKHLLRKKFNISRAEAAEAASETEAEAAEIAEVAEAAEIAEEAEVASSLLVVVLNDSQPFLFFCFSVNAANRLTDSLYVSSVLSAASLSLNLMKADPLNNPMKYTVKAADVANEIRKLGKQQFYFCYLLLLLRCCFPQQTTYLRCCVEAWCKLSVHRLRSSR